MKPDPLQLAHAREFPGEVAAVLARQPAEELRAFLAALPAAAAAAVIAALPSSLAQRALVESEGERIGALLDAADFETAVCLLSRVRPEAREALMARAASAKRRRELTARFRFAEDSLGAIASRDFIALPLGVTLRDVVAELRAENIAPGEAPPIYILSHDGRLHGALDIYRGLGTEDLALPAEQCLIAADPLPAEMPLESALRSSRWREATIVPVVDREHHLLGSVTLQRIRDAARPGSDRDGFEVVADLSRRYLEVLAGITEVTLGRSDRR